MGKSKVDSQQSKVESWEQAEFLMDQYADLAAARARQQSSLDVEIVKVRAAYQNDLQSLDSQLSTLNSRLEAFASTRKADFKAAPDGDGRSYQHAGITIGFRKLLDKVALPRGDAKKQVAIDYLVQYRPEFVRRTPEFDLVKLLAALKDGSAELVRALDDKAGITLKPGKDEFFLKVKES